MTPAHITAFCQAHALEAEVVILSEHTPTVETAAKALGVTPEQIGKSILFIVEDRPIMVVANGLNRVDYKRIADYLGVSRKKLKLADAEQVLAITGFPVGAVPPIGHKTQLRVLVDSGVLAQPVIYAGGGGLDALLRIYPADIVRVMNAESVDVVSSPAER